MIPQLLEWLSTFEWFTSSWVYSVLQIFNQIQFRALFGAALAFALVLVLGRPIIAWLRRKKIGDSGLTDAAGLAVASKAKANTPTMGGILVIGAIVFVTLLLGDITNFYLQMGLIVTVAYALLGGVDDWLKLTAATRKNSSRQGLYSWEKLVFQLGIAVLIGYFAFNHGYANPDGNNVAHVLNLPFQKTYEPGSGALAAGLMYLPLGLYVVLATLMIAGMSNAVNITDGMDGLAGGISAIVALCLMVIVGISGWQAASQFLLVPFIAESEELAVLAGAMAGACVGFLWFNCSPASVFMGDTGALALGGIIGYIAVIVRQEIVVLLICTVFLIEIGSVVLQVGYFKATKGKRIFRVAPYHHHLHMLGWTEQQVVVRFWIVSILVSVMALASLKMR